MNKLNAVMSLVVMMLAACGESNLSITEATYQPKIAVQGILIPGQVPQIKISRNFPVNVVIDPADIAIPNASVTISDAAGARRTLLYNPQTQAYEAQFDVAYNTTYTLNVEAGIDGRTLHASATTTVPNAGFKILEERSNLGSMVYRQRDAQGNLINFDVVFERSPGTGYYLVSLVALDADTSKFIYDNPFRELTAEDVFTDFEEYKYLYYWLQDRPLTPGISNTEILSLFTFFYSRYRVIIYAADRNFRDFQITHELLQGIDGNYHEPAFHIEGDGIGVFGSAVADTAYFEILRP
ncbi:DUF4249 family protein [bacterium]|nr:MAG: DUF4249 family protein [candidate division KSB1 bacterium]MBC6948749.1 DUF4249 family protein [candidate division KSB1 bacterium]MCE7940572.1 DUF4249 family protein [Chlorobi bacterium CHB1]MCL4705913.1 DUF4249 family protein [bacterium]MDL1876570.1 DUF4249 family protein [Cytophagia bacterium CHB2]